MENDLLEFKGQKNFDFFQYRYDLTANDKKEFLNDCQKVLEGAHATVLEMLKLGLRLSKLKKDGSWKEVINPADGMTFLYSSFEAFSAYAFGFKKTKTSNLLSIAEFVELDEQTGAVIYKDARYLKMNTSQLIELAPLSQYEREYFHSDISVADMRLCKKYINDSGTFWKDRQKENFDLLSSARAWTEDLKKENEAEQIREVNEELQRAAAAYSDPNEAEGRDAETFYQEFYGFGVPTSELEAESEEIPTSEFSDNVAEECRFTSRDAVRKFLASFEDWETLPSGKIFDEIKRYRFPNGVELYAAKCENCISPENGTKKTLIYYFLSLGNGIQPIKIAKSKLEIWLRSNFGI